jgi:hypothetical protein
MSLIGVEVAGAALQPGARTGQASSELGAGNCKVDPHKAAACQIEFSGWTTGLESGVKE